MPPLRKVVSSLSNLYGELMLTGNDSPTIVQFGLLQCLNYTKSV